VGRRRALRTDPGRSGRLAAAGLAERSMPGIPPDRQCHARLAIQTHDFTRRLLALTVAALTAGSVAVLHAGATPTPSQLDQETLLRARAIRAEVDAHYRFVPGRKLAVREASTTSVLDSFTLISSYLAVPRVVPADNGVYFAICSARAHCPYPTRSAAWPVAAFLPRRQALELALRTFLETSAGLVVVALPTARPVMLVLERGDVMGAVDAPALLHDLAGDPGVADVALRRAVDQLTWPSLFAPIGLAPVLGTRETLVAESVPRP